MDAVVRYTLGQPGNEQVRSVGALVGETNDGRLNDIRGLHVTREHVLEAIRSAKARSRRNRRGRHRHDLLRLEGRLGTSSRRLRDYTVGVLAQAGSAAT
jgi:D-aminopeptidase